MATGCLPQAEVAEESTYTSMESGLRRSSLASCNG